MKKTDTPDNMDGVNHVMMMPVEHLLIVAYATEEYVEKMTGHDEETMASMEQAIAALQEMRDNFSTIVEAKIGAAREKAEIWREVSERTTQA